MGQDFLERQNKSISPIRLLSCVFRSEREPDRDKKNLLLPFWAHTGSLVYLIETHAFKAVIVPYLNVNWNKIKNINRRKGIQRETKGPYGLKIMSWDLPTEMLEECLRIGKRA